MKNKHTLQHHPDNTIRSVVIKNMKSREQMLIENIGNNILKRIPGYESSYLGNIGQIRDGFNQKNNQPRHLSFENQPPHFRPQNPPPYFRPQVQPPQSHYQNRQPPQQNRPGLYSSRPQYSSSQHNRPQYNTTQYNTPYYTQNQPPYILRNQPRPDMPNHPFQHRQPQQQQPQTYQVPTAGDTISSRPQVPEPSFPTPPPVAVPQPQAAPAPLQDLLGNLDSLYHQPPVPSQAGPDLQLLQHAEPHHDYAEQPHHQQPAQAKQNQLKDQVRDNLSDSE